MPDAIYVDAAFHPETGFGAIAVVAILAEVTTVYSRFGCFDDSNKAELQAIELARDRHPGITVHSDSQIQCRLTGAVWIPREKNQRAHREAGKAYKQGIKKWRLQGAANVAKKKAKKKMRRKFVGRGRGCVLVRTKRPQNQLAQRR